MVPKGGLVPITRAFLSSYYDKHPFPPISDHVFRLTHQLHHFSNNLRNTTLPLPQEERLLLKEVESQPPHKIDENMWKNREQIEEIIFLLESSHWPKSVRSKVHEIIDHEIKLQLKNPYCQYSIVKRSSKFHLDGFRGEFLLMKKLLIDFFFLYFFFLLFVTIGQLQQQSTPEDVELANLLKQLKEKCEHILKIVESFQSRNAENVFNTVMTYMPQDFRGSLIRKQRERSERNKKAEVDALINSGGSIRDRYALLWQQQMERRRQLAQLGSAAGVYKTVVKYLVGVPQVLLDFVRQINDDEGPMEEQRHRYGPPMYALTKMVLNIHLFLSLSWWRFEDVKLQKHQISILEEAINVYISELERFLNFTGEVFANSPFFVTAGEAGAIEANKDDDYKEASVPAGTTYEISLEVESVNSYIAWDFSIAQRKISMDIGFSIEFTNSLGQKTLILPYGRYESDQGNFCTIMAGNYKLIWDNSFSTFFRKALRYKVDCIPPVVEPEAEETGKT